ncbi:MAG TPA: hypothetical protein DCZ82_02955 [Candidatus Levybacteria bacterium]|nr:hypothetical protein [Candidatus Levybacteria bacterium]
MIFPDAGTAVGFLKDILCIEAVLGKEVLIVSDTLKSVPAFAVGGRRKKVDSRKTQKRSAEVACKIFSYPARIKFASPYTPRR